MEITKEPKLFGVWHAIQLDRGAFNHEEPKFLVGSVLEPFDPMEKALQLLSPGDLETFAIGEYMEQMELVSKYSLGGVNEFLELICNS